MQRVSRHVVFLGAGASAAEGAPLQRDLFRSYFAGSGSSAIEQAWLADVSAFFHLAFAIDVRGVGPDTPLPTFEEVLGLVDLAHARGEALRGIPLDAGEELGLDLRLARRRLIFAMADAIRKRTPDIGPIHRRLVENLRAGDRLEQTSFVTTNYDTLIDDAIEDAAVSPDDRELGSVVDYGLGGLATSVVETTSRRCFQLYKLHGSLNWLHCPVCSDLVVTQGPNVIVRLLSDPTMARCTRCDTVRNPVIVPPTYFKDYSNAYLAVVWNRVARVLRHAVQVVFCGYSLPDADMHVKFLLKAAQLNTRPGGSALQFTIVNAHAGKTAAQTAVELDRYSRYLGSAVVFDSGLSFEQFASDPGSILGRPRA